MASNCARHHPLHLVKSNGYPALSEVRDARAREAARPPRPLSFDIPDRPQLRHSSSFLPLPLPSPRQPIDLITRGCGRVQSQICRRRGDPPRLCREGKPKLTCFPSLAPREVGLWPPTARVQRALSEVRDARAREAARPPPRLSFDIPDRSQLRYSSSFLPLPLPSLRGRSGERGGLRPMSEVSRSGGGPARHLKKESWY